MIHTAFIAGTYQPKHCGVAHYTSHLCKALLQEGIKSTVLTTYDAAEGIEEPDVVGAVRNWRATNLFSLVQAIHSTQADILHIQHAAGTYGFERAVFLLPFLLKLTGWRSPIISTIHEYGWWEWQPKWLPPQLLESLKTWGQQQDWWDREDGFLLTQSDAVITTNRNAKQAINFRLPDLNQKVYEIPIGANVTVSSINREQARQRVRQACHWSDEALVIAFFGFLHPVKGLETLLPAFKQVVAKHPEARLLLVGGVESLALPNEQADCYWRKLQGTIAALNLTKKVCMTGYLDDDAASHCLSGADIGVLPFNHGVTLKSGSLLALMAHSLPVIATRSNPPDADLSDRIVQLVNPRDINELATEITELLNNPEKRTQLAAAGYRFSQSFDWSSIAKTHSEIYQAVLAKKSVAVSRQMA
jgi:glycosyltransferase involved in cell wall biosynthesis